MDNVYLKIINGAIMHTNFDEGKVLFVFKETTEDTENGKQVVLSVHKEGKHKFSVGHNYKNNEDLTDSIKDMLYLKFIFGLMRIGICSI